MSFGDDMARAHQAAEEALDGEFLLIGFQPHGAAFRVWQGVGEQITSVKAEAAVHAILTALEEADRDHQDDCRTCPDCRARMARVRAALAALGPCGMIATPSLEAVH